MDDTVIKPFPSQSESGGTQFSTKQWDELHIPKYRPKPFFLILAYLCMFHFSHRAKSKCTALQPSAVFCSKTAPMMINRLILCTASTKGDIWACLQTQVVYIFTQNFLQKSRYYGEKLVDHGHVIDKHGIVADQDKLSTILQMNTFTNMPKFDYGIWYLSDPLQQQFVSVPWLTSYHVQFFSTMQTLENRPLSKSGCCRCASSALGLQKY